MFNFKALNYIRKHDIDLVYVNDLRAFYYIVIASKIARKKIVWYIRSDVPNSKATHIGFKYSDKIITIAHGVLNNIEQKKIEKYCSKFENIYTGFDFGKYQVIDKNNAKENIGISNNEFVIGYLGSINSRKGIDALVDTFIKLSSKYKKITLLIVGNISEGHTEYWDKQVRKMKNYKLKYISYTESVSEMYCAMDVFVLPSKSEGLPRVIIEALIHKTPVISTDVGGINEIINHKKTGFIISIEELNNELFEVVSFLIKNEEIRKKTAELGREFVMEKFSKDLFEKKVNLVFEEMIDKKGKSYND